MAAAVGAAAAASEQESSLLLSQRARARSYGSIVVSTTTSSSSTSTTSSTTTSSTASSATAHAEAAAVFVSHIVQPDDSLQRLALKYGVTIEQIKMSNKLYTNDSIYDYLFRLDSRIRKSKMAAKKMQRDTERSEGTADSDGSDSTYHGR